MKYILKHIRYEGSIIFDYDQQGRCMAFRFECNVTEDLWKFIFDNFPHFQESLRNAAFKNFRIAELPEDTSFDAFWNTYNYKVGNKKRTEKLWNSLNEQERILCLLKIKAYNIYMASHPTQEKCYGETFLNQRRWENSFT